MREQDVPTGANIIGSHIVYKVKTEEHGILRLRARICPHGNHDDELEEVGKESATAQFDFSRLMLALTTMLSFRIGLVDIKGAYLQSGPIQRELYVRQPKGCKTTQRGLLWHLTKLPYGITETGRQCAATMENWTTNVLGLERVYGVSQMFVKRGRNYELMFIVIKLTDDLLFSGRN